MTLVEDLLEGPEAPADDLAEPARRSGVAAVRVDRPLTLRPQRRSALRRFGAVLLRLLRPREGKVVFVASAVPLCTFAVFMSLSRHLAFADALTRMNNAESVIFSADPHLAAIGFTYGPLPSFFEMILLPLAKIWPELQVYNVIGGVLTALCAAGTMATIVATARELRLPRFARYGLALGVGAHPVYLVYATNGMAEGINIFFLALATRYVLRWLDSTSASLDSDLLKAGIALSAAYLTRIESIASGLAVPVLIGLAVFLRTRGDLKTRRVEAAMAGTLVGLPFLFTLLVWLSLCKIILGKWFPALGGKLVGDAVAGLNTTLGQTLGQGKDYNDLGTRLQFLGQQTLGMTPLVVAAIIVLLLFLPVRLDFRGLAPIATFGASLSVDVVQLIQGSSFANLRYFMIVIPLTVYGLMMFAALPYDRPRRRPDGRPRLLRNFGLVVTLTSLTAVGLAVTGPLAGVRLIRDTKLAAQERPWWDSALNGDKAALGSDVNTFIDQREAARYVDGLRTSRGTVLIDAGATSALLAGSRDRAKFLTNADRTWERSVADPGRFGVRYLMVTDAKGLAGDALDRAYPKLFIEGGGIADPVAEFGSIRLYRLRGTPLPQRSDGADRAPSGGFGSG